MSPAFQENVVNSEREFAVDGRPVLRILRHDDDVAVQPQFLTVILSNVWVIPLHAGVLKR